MKKGYKGIVIAVVLAVVLTAGVSAQIDTNVDDMKSAFGDFSGDVAQSLPYAATIGGSWSDAKVMNFPHFGAGLSLGMITLPSDAFTTLADKLGTSFGDIANKDLGVPLPGYTIDGRVGLPIVPFDVGAKFGYMHPALGEAFESATGAKADYLLAGVDIRYPVIKQKLLIPSVAVSAGVNYLRGGVEITPDTNSGTIDLSQLQGYGTGDEISFSDPTMRFNWQSTSLDFRAQASEKLLLFTFYGGGGYSYGISKAGGGILSTWTENTSNSKEQVKSDLQDAGYDISDKEITVLANANGGSFHAFAGMSVDLLFLRLDLKGKYNFLTQHLGAGLNARIQL